MLACLIAGAGLVVGPPARLGLAPIARVRMCDAAAPAPSSLLEKLTDDRMASMQYWDEMAEAYAGAAGVPYVAPDNMGEKKEWETTEIDLEQFTALLASKGDSDLPEDKVKEMFTSVDTNGDGKIEFVKYFQALTQEAKARRPNPFGGFFGGKK